LKLISKQALGLQFANDIVDEELFNQDHHKEVMNMEYIESSEEEKKAPKQKNISFKNNKELE